MRLADGKEKAWRMSRSCIAASDRTRSSSASSGLPSKASLTPSPPRADRSTMPEPEHDGSSRRYSASHCGDAVGSTERKSPSCTLTMRCAMACFRRRPSVCARCASRSIASTLPLAPTSDASCVVLLPGAAQQSTHDAPVAGFNAAGGKQDALSCRMSAPDATIA
eukprot:4869050-Pleurochrysis_carterae.AAC.1